MADQRIENVIIIGSGPAGYTAALYTARASLDPLVIEGFAWGGLLQQTTDVENYPGFSDGIMGPDLMQAFRAQAERFGARLVTEDAERVELSSEPGGVHRVWVGGTERLARTVILAMGAQHRKLGIAGEQELGGRGVSYCATCDAAFFRGAHTAVIGGGDSAMEEAIFLSKFATTVTVVHRREEFRASKIMLERAREQENIELLTPYVVSEILPGEQGTLARLVLRHSGASAAPGNGGVAGAGAGGSDGVAGDGAAAAGERAAAAGERAAAAGERAAAGGTRELDVTGLFIAIGHEPQSDLVRGQVDVDEQGYVKTDQPSTRTNRPGVFAAGDLVDHTYRQAITAAGSGCQAALDAEWYLRDTPHVPVSGSMSAGDPAEAQWAPAAVERA